MQQSVYPLRKNLYKTDTETVKLSNGYHQPCDGFCKKSPLVKVEPVWQYWAKFCHLSTFLLGPFCIFGNKGSCKTRFVVFFTFKSGFDVVFLDFQFQFWYFLATVLVTFPNIGQIFSITWSLWIKPFSMGLILLNTTDFFAKIQTIFAKIYMIFCQNSDDFCPNSQNSDDFCPKIRWFFAKIQMIFAQIPKIQVIFAPKLDDFCQYSDDFW